MRFNKKFNKDKELILKSKTAMHTLKNKEIIIFMGKELTAMFFMINKEIIQNLIII
jgi:hypothetical protein